MPGEFSNTGSALALNAIAGQYATPFGGTDQTRYLALLTAVPTDTSTGSTITEPGAGTGYARQTVAFSTPAGDPVEISNSGSVSFTFSGTIPGGGVTVTHWAVVTASTAGNVVAWGSWDTSRAVTTTGDVLQVAAGALKIRCD
jgi:hypothetical protein